MSHRVRGLVADPVGGRQSRLKRERKKNCKERRHRSIQTLLVQASASSRCPPASLTSLSGTGHSVGRLPSALPAFSVVWADDSVCGELPPLSVVFSTFDVAIASFALDVVAAATLSDRLGRRIPYPRHRLEGADSLPRYSPRVTAILLGLRPEAPPSSLATPPLHLFPVLLSPALPGEPLLLLLRVPARLRARTAGPGRLHTCFPGVDGDLSPMCDLGCLVFPFHLHASLPPFPLSSGPGAHVSLSPVWLCEGSFSRDVQYASPASEPGGVHRCFSPERTAQ